MKQLVYLSPVPWKSFAQRPHKFVEWFHATTKGKVLWIEPYPTRFPVFSDIKRLQRTRSKENELPPFWLKVVRVFALPIEPLPGSGLVNHFFWSTVLKEIKGFLVQQPTLLAIGKPSVLACMLLNRYPKMISLYDAMDDFSSFYSGISSLAMAWREKKLIRKITKIMVSSTALKEHWIQSRIDVKLVPNGLDSSILPALKTDVRAYENKVLGYVGTIGPWFDWDWIIRLAKVRPQDTIRLIGPLFVALPSLPGNVEVLPPCTHQEALKAMQMFDVGLIPFMHNHLTISVDPIKYYEYRAIGLPVISTVFGEMAFRENELGTFLSHKGQDLNNVVQKALSYSPNQDVIQQFRVNNTWEKRFGSANII